MTGAVRSLSTLGGVLGRLESCVDELLGCGLAQASADELLDALRRIEAIVRRVPAVQNGVVAEVVARGVPAEHSRRPAVFLRDLLRLSNADANGRVRAAELLGPRRAMTGQALQPRYPQLAAAVADGAVSAEQVRVVLDTVEKAAGKTHQAEVDELAADLADVAREHGPRYLRREAGERLFLIDQDGDPPSEDAQARGRGLTVGPQRGNGMYPVTGELDATTGNALLAVLEPLAAPQPQAGGGVDPRTKAQRLHDGLRELAFGYLGKEKRPEQAGMPITLLVTVTLADLEARAGTARTVHGGRIAVEDLTRYAGSTKAIPVVFDTTGAPLWIGRGKRLASVHQRRALVARDRGCTHPDCTAEPWRCQVHHLDDWQYQGDTDIDRMTLVCPHHHRLVNDWQIHITDGRAHWTPPAWIDPTRTPKTNTHHRRQ